MSTTVESLIVTCFVRVSVIECIRYRTKTLRPSQNVKMSTLYVFFTRSDNTFDIERMEE